jgi:serine protease AprX
VFVGSINLQRGRALTVVVVALLVAAVLGTAGPARGTAAPGTATVGVIVQKWSAADQGPERTVARLGGRVTDALPIVAGFAATLPGWAVAKLARSPGVLAVTPDRRVHVQGTASGSEVRSVYPKVVRADKAWQQRVTDSGVTVAVVDTGVASVPDLAGRLVPIIEGLGQPKPCKNLSGELNCSDAYGHGTFIAGLIAGNGASSGGTWKGVAPGARILSVKIAGADGAADVSNVLAALQWVVSFKDRYGIRVLNLSLGTDSTQSYLLDPLNYAVERAWAAGIVVVVAASNRGPDPQTISQAGRRPLGDHRRRHRRPRDDQPLRRPAAGLLRQGPTAADGLATPDLVAPGAHMISLRAPGSTIDTQFPWYVDGSYRRGSGTSMAAGVVSGAAALMLQANPSITPDRAKFALLATARRAASDDPLAVGSGLLDAYAAALATPSGVVNLGLGHSNGHGSLGVSRGTVQTLADDPVGTVLGPVLGSVPGAQLLLWNPLGYTGGGWRESDWYLSTWNVFRFYRVNWHGSDWPGHRWHGSSWYGRGQDESYGSSLPGSAWYGAWD